MATSTGAALLAYAGIAALALTVGRSVALPIARRVEVTFNPPAPPPPPPPEPPKPRMEPRREPKPVARTEAAPPAAAPEPAPTPVAVPTEVSKVAPEASTPTSAASLTVAPHAGVPGGTIGGTGDKPINLPENGEPAVPSPDNAPPHMPSEAQASGWEGRVVLKGVIGIDGTVTALQVLRVTVKSGNATSTAGADHPFAREALAAIRGWHFTPAKIDGAPIAVYRIFNINFQSGVGG